MVLTVFNLWYFNKTSLSFILVKDVIKRTSPELDASQVQKSAAGHSISTILFEIYSYQIKSHAPLVKICGKIAETINEQGNIEYEIGSM